MSTMSKVHSRTDRLREYAGAMDLARIPIAAMGLLVRSREAREWTPSDPPEVVFAQTLVDDRALPAGVWVALRRDDVSGALDAMAAVSQKTFLVEAREEMGEGYRLQTVEETRPLPEIDLLLAQLAQMLDIPQDVLAILAEWGPDDPRTESEIGDLLDRRLGASTRPPAPAAPQEPEGRHAADAGDGLTMSVAETTDVLRLTEEQARALATLVRRVSVTITA
ncbi:MAG: hypothetical protein ACRDVG_01965 [Jatrophihabitantaceae bacterium]